MILLLNLWPKIKRLMEARHKWEERIIKIREKGSKYGFSWPPAKRSANEENGFKIKMASQRQCQTEANFQQRWPLHWEMFGKGKVSHKMATLQRRCWKKAPKKMASTLPLFLKNCLWVCFKLTPTQQLRVLSEFLKGPWFYRVSKKLKCFLGAGWTHYDYFLQKLTMSVRQQDFLFF